MPVNGKNPFDEPISMVDDEPILIEGGPSRPAAKPGIKSPASPASPAGPAAPPPSAVKAIKTTLDMGRKTQFRRPMNNTGKGATRCRLFHCKIAESSMEHLQSQINSWLDDDEINVKCVGHMVGTMEGKHNEPNIVIMIWY